MNQSIEQLDLSDNDAGTRGARSLAALLDENDAISELVRPPALHDATDGVEGGAV